MERFLVSAATGAMTSLLGKLGTMLTDEYKLLKDVRGDIEFLEDEFETMQAFLLNMADVEEPDHQAKLRADAVRELSYDIEDKIDKFMVLVNHESSSKSESFKELFNKSMKKITNINTHHKIAKDVKDIKSHVKDVADRYARYKIDEPSMRRNEKVDPRLCAVYKDTSELVGIDTPRDELMKLLTYEEDGLAKQLKVVSIVGTGGLGKTTLARQIYNKLGAKFDCQVFVSISRSPDMSNILNSILSQLGQGQDHAGSRDPQLLIEHIRKFLEDKRYLMVIDDVWDVPTWRILECAFVKGSCGSRVMSTTRNNDVAKSCCSSDMNLVYKIKPLSDSDSAKLFFKRIFGCEERCPSNLKEVSEDILRKCGGLPLAINAISSLLATGRRKTEQEWNRVRSSITSAEGKSSDIEAMKYILSLSYFDLPLHLRSCLLYLTMFPEDYEIRRKRLVHRWISEGFIHGKDGDDLVELGDMYFYELINRSLIQPVKVKYNGMVSCCRVHDTVLDFLIYLSDRENFSTLLINKEKLDRRIRRLSLMGNEDQGIIEQLDLSHARSLGVFGRPNQLPSLVKSDALRVLDLEGSGGSGLGLENHHVKDIGRLIQLRYLSINGIYITELPKQIGDLEYLETLVTGYTMTMLPKSVCRLKRLACLSVAHTMKLPDAIGNMENLKDLGEINPFLQSLNFAEELGKLINLRKLKIVWDSSESDSACYKEKLVSSLCKLDKCNLRTLCIEFWLTKEDDFIKDLCFPSLNCVRNICLWNGQIRWIVKWLLSLANLQNLKIWNGEKIEQQDVDMVGSISTLVEFQLRALYYDITIITIGGGFQQLQKFCFDGHNGLIFEAGAMPNLMELQLIVDPSKLKCSASDYCFGIQHLASLASINVFIFCEGVKAADVEAVESALKSMAEANPNLPALEISKWMAESSSSAQSILHPHHDNQHRAMLMAERGEVLEPLRLRSHSVHITKDMKKGEFMHYDERYTEFIEMTGLLPYINMVTRSMPNMNPSAITALIDWWRTDTHTFHLRVGEMAVTLQDVSMILALPIDGAPFVFDTASGGWRSQMASLIGTTLAEKTAKEEKKKDRLPAGATYVWIIEHFGKCPIEADRDTVHTYTRVYIWYVISRTLFPDGGGTTASWVWLKALTDLTRKISWGSVVLAYLYRQLDEACKRTGTESGIGGPLLLLSVWMWVHFLIGRAKVVNFYPYGLGDDVGDTYGEFELNPMCLKDRHLWMIKAPMICLWVGEWHLPHRVLSQFGLYQSFPLEWVDTSIYLHGLDRKLQKKVTNVEKEHHNYVVMWNQECYKFEVGLGDAETRVLDIENYNNYVAWFHGVTHLELCSPAFPQDIVDGPLHYEQLSRSRYTKLVREGRRTEFAPLINLMRDSITCEAELAEDALTCAPGPTREKVLQGFVKRSAAQLCHIGNVFVCREIKVATPSRDTSSSSHGHGHQEETSVEVEDIPDDMTLSQYRSSPRYTLHQRKTLLRYSPTQEEERSQRLNKKNRVAGRVKGKGKATSFIDDDDVQDPPRRRSSRNVGRK